MPGARVNSPGCQGEQDEAEPNPAAASVRVERFGTRVTLADRHDGLRSHVRTPPSRTNDTCGTRLKHRGHPTLAEEDSTTCRTSDASHRGFTCTRRQSTAAAHRGVARYGPRDTPPGSRCLGLEA